MLTLLVALPLLLAAEPTLKASVDQAWTRPPEEGGGHGVILIAHHGETLYRNTAGFADRDREEPIAEDTPFLIASLTKSFTATLVLQLVEEETLALTDSVHEHLPWYRADTGSRVTIHHLLSHTSGIPNYLADVDYFGKGSQIPYERRSFVETFCSGDLEFEPGSQYAYSPSGYVILGEILETVTNQSLAQMFRERIGTPLNLNATGFAPRHDDIPELARGHAHARSGYRPARPFELSTAGASGAMYSTVDDLLTWYRASADGTFLSNASRQEMYTAHREEYGYGWFISSRTVAGRELRIHHHGGRINGFNSAILHVPQNALFIIILQNVEQFSSLTMGFEMLELLYTADPDTTSEE